MPPVLRQGWEVNNPAVSSTEFKAKIRVTAVSGSSTGRSTQIVVVNNTSTGAFDYYTPTSFGFGTPFASYSPFQDKLIPKDKGTFDLFFDQNTPTGKSQLTNITNSTKLATYDLAQTSNQDFENVKKLKGYQSLANSTPPGERAPRAIPGAPAGASKTNPTTSIEQLNSLASIGIEGIKPKLDYGLMRYPIDIESDSDNRQDVIKFTVKTYGGRAINTKFTGFEKRKDTTGSLAGHVVLPIQPTIIDQNLVNWSGTGMNAIQLGAAGASLNIIDKGGAAISNEAEKLINLFKAENTNLATAIKIAFAEKAASTQNLLSRISGAIINPNMELLFEGPGLRTFNYNFQLSPRSGPEGQMVVRIINFFKRNMAVQRTEAELFLKAPNIFNIQYQLGQDGKDHPYINRIKTCALTNCSVDYTPGGSYMTYIDGVMVSYNLNLTFQELEPVYEDEYNEYNHPIGY